MGLQSSQHWIELDQFLGKDGHDLDQGTYWADGTPGRFGCRLRAGASAGSPVIITQPVSQTVRPGGDAVFSASAAGADPLAYQWHWYDMVDEFDEGNTTPNLVIDDAADYDAGPYTLWVSNSQGSALSRTATLSVLPSPWLSLDLGDVGEPGWAEFDADVYRVQGSGSDIGGRYDSFQFVHQPITGQGSIVAQITSLKGSDSSAKVGVMMREKLSAGSRHALMTLTPGNGTSFQWRLNPAEPTTATTPGDGIQAPCWVKLERAGSTFTGYRSANGIDWILVGTAPIAMSNSAYCGLVVCSRVKGERHEGVFGKVQVSSNSVPALAAPDIAFQSASQTVALGSTVLFMVVVTNAPVLSYQWQCNGVNLADGGGITGATTATLTLANVQSSQAGIYSVVAANAAGAATAYVTLAIQQPDECQITDFRLRPNRRLEAMFPSHQFAWLEWTPSLISPSWQAIQGTSIEPDLASLEPMATAVWTNLPRFVEQRLFPR